MYLFFDTETVGLPKNYNAPVTDLNNWPRMVQIAWILSDKNGECVEADDFIIKPEGFNIPDQSSALHGISTQKALDEGEDLGKVLTLFNAAVEKADLLIAHNIRFDEKIVGAEFLRMKIETSFEKKRKLCTMRSSTDYCKLPGPYGYKWPTLSELYKKLFSTTFKEAHNATVDIKATEKCFWEMRKKGVV
jgi:DNA polymerase-3 subunit epsilon